MHSSTVTMHCNKLSELETKPFVSQVRCGTISENRAANWEETPTLRHSRGRSVTTDGEGHRGSKIREDGKKNTYKPSVEKVEGAWTRTKPALSKPNLARSLLFH